MKLIMGKKVGMTQIFDDSGKAIPVTVVNAGPVYVTQVSQNDDSTRVQVGYGEAKKLTKPVKGHLEKSGIKQSLKHLQEFPVTSENVADWSLGKEIKVDIFQSGDKVDVIGTSKGKGFAGTIKRHNFHRGPVTHGSHNIRQPGSIGSAYPQRVFKGRKMPGHMGAERVTIKDLKIVDVDTNKNLLVIAGAVPGARGTLLTIKGA